jgi:hypothetical protein
MSEDLPEQPSPARDLIAFTPVPREKDRSNGWKPEVQRAFIEALADTGSVKAACRAVGRADHGAYRLRRQPGAEEFAAAWQAALDHGIKRIEDVAMERALNGVEVPVYSYGKLVGTRRVYNDRLLMFMLRNRAPERFSPADNLRALNAVDRMRIERLKKKWLQERLALEQEEEAETIESLDAFFENLRQRRLANEAILAESEYEEEEELEEDELDEDELDELDTAHEPDGSQPLTESAALPTPAEPDEPAPPQRREPRIRTLKDGRWT